MGGSDSKSDEYLSDVNENENQKFAAVVSTALEKDSFDQNYSYYENKKIEHIQNNLKFHSVCGKNISFSDIQETSNKKDRVQAERNESSYCDSIVFSERPISVYERVYITILKLSTCWNGMIRFGLTSINPEKLRITETDLNNNQVEIIDLPKYMYPDLTNKEGYWAASMPENSIIESDTIFFYVDSFGDLHYGVNERYCGIFLSGVHVYNRVSGYQQPLWAIIDIYGNTLAIQLTTYSQKNILQSIASNEDNLPKSLNSIGSSSSNASSYKSSNYSSSVITVIPNYHLDNTTSNLKLNQPKANPRPPSLPKTRPPPLPKIGPQKLNVNSTKGCSKYENEDDKLERLLVSFRRQCVDNHLNETLHNSIMHSSSIDINKNMPSAINREPSQNKLMFDSIPIIFHEPLQTTQPKKINNFKSDIHGVNVNVNENEGLIAYRNKNNLQMKFQQPTTNSYVFLNEPIEYGKRTFCLQIIGTDQSKEEQKMSLSIGCTTCDPKTLKINDLPNDSYILLDRPEYWIVFKNFYNDEKKKKYLNVADELCFKINEQTGDLGFSVNGNLITNCLFNVDLTQKLFFFFDLCGKINGIRLIQSCNEIHENHESFSREYKDVEMNTSTPFIRNDGKQKSKRKLRPNSALIEFYRNQLTFESVNEPQVTAENTKTNPVEKRKSFVKEECRICWENPIECVLYSCGHMCLCWKCANNLKNQINVNKSGTTEKPRCPICRIEIIDIIRFFKS